MRYKLAAHIVYQKSVRQLCAANLWRTLCTRTVRDNCAPQTCGAHIIVCQNSARQLCAANLWHTLCARTVRQKSNLHTKNAFAANLPQLCAANLPHICCKFAAYMYQRPYILVREIIIITYRPILNFLAVKVETQHFIFGLLNNYVNSTMNIWWRKITECIW